MKHTWILLTGLILTGCLGGRSTPPQFYTLNTTVCTAPHPAAAATVALTRVQVPRALDRPQMVVFDATRPEAQVSEMNRWLEPLPNLINQALIADLSACLPNAVVKKRTTAQEQFDYFLSLEITQLTVVPGQSATLDGWAMIRRSSGQLVARLRLNDSVPVGATYADAAAAQSTLLGRAATTIAARIADLKP